MVIYVGDANDVAKRILTNHGRGNVEGSALRRHIAAAMGFRISSFKRGSGTTRVRIDSDSPKQDEETITAYIRGGTWRIVPCSTYEEANDFQWFLIDRLNPLCNVSRDTWNANNTARYEQLLQICTTGRAMTFDELKASGYNSPGVYVLEHRNRPDA